jgi:hypothetical protein
VVGGDAIFGPYIVLEIILRNLVMIKLWTILVDQNFKKHCVLNFCEFYPHDHNRHWKAIKIGFQLLVNLIHIYVDFYLKYQLKFVKFIQSKLPRSFSPIENECENSSEFDFTEARSTTIVVSIQSNNSHR